MKKIFIGILLFSSFKVSSQNLKTTIKIQAMDMAGALIKNDFTTFLKYMHPKIVVYAGGQSKLKTQMDSAASAMKQFSVSFKKILIGEPGEIISYKKQLQCVVPESTDMESILGDISVETSLIAVSENNGKNWYFIDTNVYKVDKIKSAFPDLSPKLVIPPQKQPKFTPNDKNQ